MAGWYRWDPRADGHQLLLNINLQPGSRQNEIVGQHGDALKIRITSAPVGGKANEQLIAFLASFLGLNKRKIRLESGQTSRRKCLRIELDEPVLPTALHNI